MSAASRRTFLKFSSATLGVCAVGLPSPAPSAPAVKRRHEAARVYMVLFGTAPSQDDTSLHPDSNDEIILKLKDACPGVEFTIRDMSRGGRFETVLNELKDIRKQGYDGVIIYGVPRDYDLIRTGLPTINVAVVNDFQNLAVPLYEPNRVVRAMLDPWHFCADAKIAEQMFRDLVDKIKLIKSLKRMKSEHLLTVTDSPYVNVTYGDVLKHMPEDYNQRITGAIASVFGTRISKIGTQDVVDDKVIKNLWYGESKEADEIARRWICCATKMTYTIESEVVRAAKLYLAMKHLMERYDATSMAYHIRTMIRDPRPEDYVAPALAVSEFQLHNTVAKCQSHLNIILSEMLLQYAYEQPSMMGDYGVDTYNNTSIVQHCEGPWNPWGDERRVPYMLTDHRERPVRVRAKTGVGAAACILYPADEPVTMWQIDVFSKEILVHTGKTVPMFKGRVVYKDHFYEMM
jgi:hypothetical protein